LVFSGVGLDTFQKGARRLYVGLTEIATMLAGEHVLVGR
jgi:hypothetical protein